MREYTHAQLLNDPPPAGLPPRLEGCRDDADARASLLLLSLSDAAADYLLIPRECRTPAWARMMDDLHAAGACLA